LEHESAVGRAHDARKARVAILVVLDGAVVIAGEVALAAARLVADRRLGGGAAPARRNDERECAETNDRRLPHGASLPARGPRMQPATGSPAGCAGSSG